jgi:hypothetical protein
VHKVLEDRLYDWYNESRAQGGYISGPMIAARAQELHKELGYTDNFTASNGWLDRFKVRNGIKLCGLREVKTESDINAVEPFKAELASLASWYNLTLEQIYNADESDLFWKMLPNPESDVNEVKASVRAYRERMTVMCCTNATGSHKLPLVCIGRGKKSRTFTSHEVKTMPVNYFSQETAWMDQDIFREWFHSYFVPSVRQHLRYQGLPETALLLIDRSTSHPPDQFLRSEDGFFFCHFFTPKVKSLMQPMEQGIISNMKRHYRRDLLLELIAKETSISEFQKGITLKDAVRGIAQGWEAVTEDTIRSSFSKVLPAANESVQVDSSAFEQLINTESFAKLLRKIPECEGYSYERLEKWLNCDEAEPQKDCNPFKTEQKMEGDSIDKIMFIDLPDETHQTIEIFNSSDLQQATVEHATIIEPETDDELVEEEDDMQETLNQIQIHESNEVIYEEEESSEVTCKQALNALNVVLKFMKNDADSRYKDVVMLEELKNKLRVKLDDLPLVKPEFST